MLLKRADFRWPGGSRQESGPICANRFARMQSQNKPYLQNVRAIRVNRLKAAIRMFRKILVSVKFLSAILGPEMGVSILWTPGKNALFLQEKPMSIKFLDFFGGGGILGFWGGECRFYFCGRADFSDMF